MGKQKVKLDIDSKRSECGDGCCVEYLYKLIVNNHDIGYYDDSDTVGNIKAVLEYLGYEVET